MATIIFDIETGALPREQALSLVDAFRPYQPLEPWQDWPPFDPAEVKLGNTKDENKIKEKIEAARDKYATDQAKAKAEHERKLATAEADYAAEKVAYEDKALEKAALSALTGQVLAIGYLNPALESPVCIETQGDRFNENQLLERFWKRWQKAEGSRWIGFNSNRFDVPFLVQRSIILGVSVPAQVLNLSGGKIYLSPSFIDLMPVWLCGVYGATFVSLDKLGTALDCGCKADCTTVDPATGEVVPVSGKDFAKLLAADPEKAREYLANDLKVTLGVAQRLGVV